MKIRIGYGLGTRTATDRNRLIELADGLEGLGFDSLWLSERVGSTCPDPIVALSFVAARTSRLKIGMSVLVLPGRNPVLLAKSLATLDRLSDGRLLPAFGLGVADSAEHRAFGVERAERAPWFNEALPLIRRLWSESSVDHHGPRFDLAGVTVEPRPVQDPIEVWLGGAAPAELRRVGKLADGWLPSFRLPEQVAEGRKLVEETAAGVGRTIDPEHFGALIAYRRAGGPVGGPIGEVLARRNPDVDPERILPTLADLPRTVESFVEVGFSKFVLVPVDEPSSWTQELETVAALVKPMEN